jgi:predicted DNA repair protein MutK
MAGASLLALLDDIATVLDDVAVLSKVAAKKSAGVLGDDLAVNAEQVSGVQAKRELPVVWAVAKGSLVNKVILVPAALLVSQFAPWAVTPLMVLGGLFLCYEGFEKVAHRSLHSEEDDAAARAAVTAAAADPAVDLVAWERDKIKGAIRTDFILSAEIIVITLGVVGAAPFATRLGTLTAISLLMTVGVYGLVAGIVKLDDAGLHLASRRGDGALDRALRALGRGLLGAAPRLMKFLGVAGTVAMFLVGGGILTHALHLVPSNLALALLTDLAVGAAAGAVVLGAVLLVERLRSKR